MVKFECQTGSEPVGLSVGPASWRLQGQYHNFTLGPWVQRHIGPKQERLQIWFGLLLKCGSLFVWRYWVCSNFVIRYNDELQVWSNLIRLCYDLGPTKSSVCRNLKILNFTPLHVHLWHVLLCYSLLSTKFNMIGASSLQGFRVFSYKELKTATGGFRSSNKVGEGSFGSVYKVIINFSTR